MTKSFAFAAALLAAMAALPAEAALRLLPDHSVEVTSADGRTATFAPDFVVLQRSDDPKVGMRPSGLKSVNYNVPTWVAQPGAKADYAAVQRGAGVAGDGFDDRILEGDAEGRTANLFAAAENIALRASDSRLSADGRSITWSFPEDARFSLSATLAEPAGANRPVLTFTFTPKTEAWFSVGYRGAPAAGAADLLEAWQPLIWTEKRLPERPYLTASYMCPLPAALTTRVDGTTTGVIADPVEIPFQPLPTFENSRFGIALRDRDDRFRGMAFAPMLGGPGSKRAAGERFSFKLHLVVTAEPITTHFETLARELYGFSDFRHNDIGSLNTTLDNMIAYGLSDYSWFIPELKGPSYSTDVPGSVKNVSSLNPLSVALVTDYPRAFNERGYPIAEFMLSREKTLFVLDPKMKIQSPSRKLLGPTAPVSELAVLHGVTGGQIFRTLAETKIAKAPASKDWRQWLSLWENTGEKAHLDRAVELADAYLKRRYEKPITGFSDPDAGGLFFWTSHAPHWIELVRLYEATKERRFIEAAREGARRFAMYIWMCPLVPDERILVNEGGVAPHYWYLQRKGHTQMKVPEELAPAWRLSEIGLTPESSGTSAGHRAIFMANHAPWMHRIAQLTGDRFLHDIARHAIIGRYLNFPGYHINTARTTAYEKADYPLRSHKELSVNSFHYNHIWPHMSILLDYLVADATARSEDRISFPSRYIEGYAYLKSRFLGDRPGRFYDLVDAYLWMPSGLVRSSNVELNHVSAREGDTFAIAFLNESAAPQRASIALDLARFEGLPGATRSATVLINNAPAAPINVVNGRFEVEVPPRGIVALTVPDARPRLSAGRELRAKSWTQDYVEGAVGEARSMILDFGPGRRNVFTYLREDDSKVKRAELEITIDGVTTKHRDDAYPFEWTNALTESCKKVQVRVRLSRPDGKTETTSVLELHR